MPFLRLVSFLLRVENFRIEEGEEDDKHRREKIYMYIKKKHKTQGARERERVEKQRQSD